MMRLWQRVWRKVAHRSRERLGTRRSEQVDRPEARVRAASADAHISAAFWGEAWTLSAPGQAGQCFPILHV